MTNQYDWIVEREPEKVPFFFTDKGGMASHKQLTEIFVKVLNRKRTTVASLIQSSSCRSKILRDMRENPNSLIKNT